MCVCVCVITDDITLNVDVKGFVVTSPDFAHPETYA